MTFTSIRRATATDVPTPTQIRNDAHEKKVAHCDYAWGKEGDGFSETWVLDSLSRRDVYVVEQDGTPVGTFSLDWNDEAHWGPQEPDAGYVHGICVRKGFNGRGLGSVAIDWCAGKVSAFNRRFVRLDCDVGNAKLCAYYESLGFNRVGLKPTPDSGANIWSLYEKSVLQLSSRRP
ncbi:GCN5 family acetyltransferase [Burkholderia sp. PAMC 28687]|uniref:GNAT family N-acetyltransferase n=1 Tax=Burkholderia sp. PAMC 28687 TaxID=1795874 RepID=UPI000782BDCA|nr:GNAT family N-acetyltransferase [Burkholderia sp. PAMC 28687]AMM16043.1 GCN5 family acetyltransferase [Burkholderia sp. PAMC 28687]